MIANVIILVKSFAFKSRHLGERKAYFCVCFRFWLRSYNEIMEIFAKVF